MERAEGVPQPKFRNVRTQLQVSIERRPHTALYVRDASGLDVVSEGVPPKGGMMVGSEIEMLSRNLNMENAAQVWLSWWKSIIEWDYMLTPATSAKERARREAEIAGYEANKDLRPLISRFADQATWRYNSWEFTQASEAGKQELRSICGRAFDRISELSSRRTGNLVTCILSISLLIYDIPWSWSPRLGYLICTTSSISRNPKALESIIARSILVA